MGQVTRPTLKSDAGNVVKDIEGVEKVDNQIQVLPLSSMDDGIRMAEYRAIYGHPGLDRYAMQAVPPIHIIVDNGKVTLEGVVANQGDKDMAGIRANTVSGVFSVSQQSARSKIAIRIRILLLRPEPVSGAGLSLITGRTVTSSVWNPPSSLLLGV